MIRTKEPKYATPELDSYINLIRKIAWSWHRSTGIEFEELQAEGVLCFYEALETYNPEMAKFSTWLTSTVRMWFLKKYKNHIAKKKAISLSDTEDIDAYVEDTTIAPAGPDAYTLVKLRRVLENLSTEARQIVGIIFTSPLEVFGEEKKLTLRALQSHLRNLGMSQKKINSIFGEIRGSVSSL